MNFYELLYIARSDLTEAQVDELNQTINNIVTAGKGNKVELVNAWGVKSLAYRSKKLRKNKGFFCLTRLTIEDPEVLTELKNRLQLNEAVIRFIIKKVPNFEEAYTPNIRKTPMNAQASN